MVDLERGDRLAQLKHLQPWTAPPICLHATSISSNNSQRGRGEKKEEQIRQSGERRE